MSFVSEEVIRDFLFKWGTYNNMEIDTSLYVFGNFRALFVYIQHILRY